MSLQEVNLMCRSRKRKLLRTVLLVLLICFSFSSSGISSTILFSNLHGKYSVRLKTSSAGILVAVSLFAFCVIRKSSDTKKGKHRIQLDFGEEAWNELHVLKQKLNVNSRAELFRYALRLLQWITEELEAGRRIYVGHKGKVSEVIFTFIPRRTETSEKRR